MPPEHLAAPGDPAGPLLTRRPLGGEIAAIVLTDDQVTGMVQAADLQGYETTPAWFTKPWRARPSQEDLRLPPSRGVQAIADRAGSPRLRAWGLQVQLAANLDVEGRVMGVI